MAAGAKARRHAQLIAAQLLERAEAERQAMLTEAIERASVIVREAEIQAADEANRLRDEALLDAKRIREEAVEEIVKMMSTLTTERDHILADARDDARRIIESAEQERDATELELDSSTPDAATENAPEDAAEDYATPRAPSLSELDELFFAGAPAPAPLAQAPPLPRRRRKRFQRRH